MLVCFALLIYYVGMDEFISPNRLAEFHQTLTKLGYDVAEESLYDAVVAIIRFLAETERLHMEKINSKGGKNDKKNKD